MTNSNSTPIRDNAHARTDRAETVLITGASSGIGRELTKHFAADSSRLILVARNRSALESLAIELNSVNQTKVDVLTADLAKPEAPDGISQELTAMGLSIDVLVNNAGFGAQGSFAELPLERQMEMLQVNITALTHLTRLLLPGMIQRRRGGILNVASTAAFEPGPFMAVYYATKAYVLSFTEALAEETAGTGVTVTALCPGPTATNFAAASGTEHSSLFKYPMAADRVAKFGYQAFRRGQVVAISGIRNRLLAFSVRLSPRWAIRKIVKHLNKSQLR